MTTMGRKCVCASILSDHINTIKEVIEGFLLGWDFKTPKTQYMDFTNKQRERRKNVAMEALKW
jgi:hypothetical protein